ncbi:hypothetical protein E2562_009033 [Oryza meyeriana var. granulata]|uniref:Uncharacterized protein n=1 Tax=Oryza meyeriana var. granulata TaxID=110450 RepID=A0A6G1D0Q3_9ORYZ|nr:hypothetical protein E2562_009033 [Oryza meyeriana var. granulata]
MSSLTTVEEAHLDSDGLDRKLASLLLLRSDTAVSGKKRRWSQLTVGMEKGASAVRGDARWQRRN